MQRGRTLEITHHQLAGEGVDRLDSPNRGGSFAIGQPDTIVVHYTACVDAGSAIAILSDPARKVSAHLVVARDATTTQLLPFDTIGWHAGKSSWKGRTALNNYAVGIEVDNAGRLQEHGGRFVSHSGTAYPATEVVRAKHRNESQYSYWHRFPDLQLHRVENLCALLIAAYGITEIVGHDEIAPDRKDDPGPAYPLDEQRQRLLPGVDGRRVTV